MFYLIASRLPIELLEQQANAVLEFVLSVIKERVGEGRFALVADMSWTHFSSKFVTGTLMRFRDRIPHHYRKNLVELYLIHPTSLIVTMFPYIRQFFPTWKKVIVCYAAESLSDHIHTADVLLPSESFGFITKAYPVTKVNSKGRKQRRLIKFTANSLLNIDPKSKSLQNEKLLVDIDHISLPTPTSIHIEFVEDSKAKSRRTLSSSLSVLI